PPASGNRRTEGHPLLLLAGQERPQRTGDNRDGVLADKSVHRMRLWLRLLLRPVHSSLRHGARRERREDDRRPRRGVQQVAAVARLRAKYLRQKECARSAEQNSSIRK